MGALKEFQQEWNFSKSSGWIQKVSDSRKALFYFIPLYNSYKISLAIRENEREQLLRDETLKFMHRQLLDAKKYSEGYALQFLIRSTGNAEDCNQLISKLTSLRRK